MKKTLKKLLMFLLLLPIIPLIGVPGDGAGAGAGESGGAGAGAGDGAGSGGTGGDGQKPPEKTHTQADVDKAVNDRLARQKKQFDKAMEDMKKQMGGDPGAGAGGGTAGTGTDGQQGTDPNAQAAAHAAIIATANTRLVQATAMTEAVKLGVDPKYTADVVKLCDLSKIEVKDDGSMDTGAIDKEISEILKRVPVFKLTTDNSGGFRVGGEGQGQQNQNTNGWVNKQPAQQQNVKPWNRQNRTL